MGKENYNSCLRNGTLTDRYIHELKSELEKHLTLEKLPEVLIKEADISERLSRLPMFIAKGSKSWQGLVVGFPGNTKDLTTTNVGTPFLRMILYPMLQLFQDLHKYLNGSPNCIYLLGARFPDVFMRKFNLLSLLVPHIIVLSNDLSKTIRSKPSSNLDVNSSNREAFYQEKLCQAMIENDGVSVPTSNGKINVGYISHEVQTAEGTINPERLDILGYDKRDSSLIAFELKGPTCDKTQFRNLFLQGLEHRNWLEENKMAIKLIKEGPKGKKINTRKRVRLILCFCNEDVPPLFHDFKDKLKKKDKYIQIDFVNVVLENGKPKLFKVDKNS